MTNTALGISRTQILVTENDAAQTLLVAICLCTMMTQPNKQHVQTSACVIRAVMWGEAQFQAASWLYMDDLWPIAKVQSLLNSSELQEPGNGHMVQAVCVIMGKMNLRPCRKKWE